MPTTEPMTHPDLGRAWAELPCWRWMPAMLADGAWRLVSPFLDGDWRATHETGLHKDYYDPKIPSTTDHATVGCLHALAEEVVGGPVDLMWYPGEGVWAAAPADPHAAIYLGPTKAHALYALVEVSRG